MPHLYKLCAGTTFVSAFLLFQIQPLISKHILPWFGGGAMVWITALFFFMFVLLAGYVYVLLLARVQELWQRIIHTALIVSTIGLLFWHSSLWSSGITPAFSSEYFTTGPVVAILYILVISIGAPFFILATTSSLVQLWYGQNTGREPFSLYAISNVGSLLGLLSYPFFLEPLFSTSSQGMIWSTIFFAYSICITLVAVFTYKLSQIKTVSLVEEQKIAMNWLQFMRWVGVASVPVIVMLSSTSFISGFVAAMPFIWIVPLALYLVSFIVSFRRGERQVSAATRLAVILSSIAALSLLSLSSYVIAPFILLALWVNVFVVAHYCHEWLYESRPPIGQLPWFYVALSLGGFLGSAAILVSTLFILKTPLEYLIVVSSVMLLSLWQLYRLPPEKLPVKIIALHISAVMVGVLLLAVVANKVGDNKYVLSTERNFFGTKRVLEQTAPDGSVMKILAHEVTNHGYEYQTGPFVGKPTAYYSETSAIGRLFTYLRRDTSNALTVASVGLGAGVLSTYCQPGDTFTFFEIDPQVIALTQTYFNFLDQCDEKTIKVGDARQLLQAEQVDGKTKYDVIIIDAYADDSVPAHLLTIEAMALYLDLLKVEGVIAIHTSSRYLDLIPVVNGLVQEHRLFGKTFTDTAPAEYATQSIWTLVAREGQVLEVADFSMMEDIAAYDVVKWTDTKNALLQVVKFNRK
jgi:hypothetical protein